ncbi:hypothetical protein LC613_27955 [Nostoc sphaeroides CHAB 2801]|uniref:hypothetical protein n=1 Tax=Nostoc sphaeroides TaxID=446679 RepID=UPI000E4BC5E5|nr:hypothetical protein [Nostoc sphaeroides]MCC5631574.1 hypothetical protein [Nostoc sphaeroides CHAB 2801]
MAKITISELPLAELEENSLLNTLSREEITAINGGGLKGAIIGGIVGFVLGGPGGAVIGAAAGSITEDLLK